MDGYQILICIHHLGWVFGKFRANSLSRSNALGVSITDVLAATLSLSITVNTSAPKHWDEFFRSPRQKVCGSGAVGVFLGF